jgi:hypothetical protein
LPHDAKDLEALLPDTMCGEAVHKVSISGASSESAIPPNWKAAVSAFGKAPSDLAWASAFSTNGCGAGILRIFGVDKATFQQAFLTDEQRNGTQATLGGKKVFVLNRGSTAKQYLYFVDDMSIFAIAKDDASAATILQALPA